MPLKAKPTAPKDSTATISFEATALRGSAFTHSEATLQILLCSREANAAKNNMSALPGQLFKVNNMGNKTVDGPIFKV